MPFFFGVAPVSLGTTFDIFDIGNCFAPGVRSTIACPSASPTRKYVSAFPNSWCPCPGFGESSGARTKLCVGTNTTFPLNSGRAAAAACALRSVSHSPGAFTHGPVSSPTTTGSFGAFRSFRTSWIRFTRFASYSGTAFFGSHPSFHPWYQTNPASSYPSAFDCGKRSLMLPSAVRTSAIMRV